MSWIIASFLQSWILNRKRTRLEILIRSRSAGSRACLAALVFFLLENSSCTALLQRSISASYDRCSDQSKFIMHRRTIFFFLSIVVNLRYFIVVLFFHYIDKVIIICKNISLNSYQKVSTWQVSSILFVFLVIFMIVIH